MGRLTRAGLFPLLTAAVLLLGLAPAVRAADVEFGRPTAEAEFGTAIRFEQPLEVVARPSRVEVRLTFPGSIGPLVVEVPPPPGPGAFTLRYAYDFTDGGHLLPNTTIEARWRVYTGPDDAEGADGPPVAIRYEDDRFTWRTLAGELVRVHWYEGSEAFGRRALEIGETAVRETAELLGVTEDEPVDFFIYPNQADFYDALGPGTRENVGGQANAEIRTLFALITPGEIDDAWVGIVVPHELVHLVFDTAVRNPYHFPPRWLNEGLAVYLSQGYDARDRGAVEAAGRSGTLIPLDGLGGQFPTTADRFYLAYAESVSAVDFLIRTYGQDALIALIRSYAEGRTDDQAFRDALGVDVAAFGAAWLADLDAEAPRRYGPQPPPPGPQPPGWQAASPGPNEPAPGGPSASPVPGAPDPGQGGGGLTGDLEPGMLVPFAAVALAAAAILVLTRRSRRRPAP